MITTRHNSKAALEDRSHVVASCTTYELRRIFVAVTSLHCSSVGGALGRPILRFKNKAVVGVIVSAWQVRLRAMFVSANSIIQ